jgi:hypothetical protein
MLIDMEKLRFIFTTACGHRFYKTIERRGVWDEHKNFRLDVPNKGEECKNCTEKDGSLFCPALGILLFRNGKKIIYPL